MLSPKEKTPTLLVFFQMIGQIQQNEFLSVSLNWSRRRQSSFLFLTPELIIQLQMGLSDISQGPSIPLNVIIQ
jgi:hypothetical protein